MKLDDRQTTLFFMSFNLLLGRKDAALKWFDYYQKTEKTGDDAGFILLLLHSTNLKDAGNDAFTKRIKQYLIEEYNRSRSMNRTDEMVELVKDHLVQYNSTENFVFDMLRRYLEYRGNQVTFVQNFTDVDDKLIRAAKENGTTRVPRNMTLSELPEEYREIRLRLRGE